MKLKKKSKLYILLFIIIVWIIFIYYLSSQNGVKTLSLSLCISEIISNIIGNDDIYLINVINAQTRKFAHIFLFFIFGFLSYIFIENFILLLKYKIITVFKIVVAIIFTSLFGFFDEWHKQFIYGRHFQYDEVILNIISCCI